MIMMSTPRLLLLLVVATRTLGAQLARPSLAEPSLSPSGEIAFASGGDIWTVSREGGDARLLVAHPATESRSGAMMGRDSPSSPIERETVTCTCSRYPPGGCFD
jgi:hypothetical protein